MELLGNDRVGSHSEAIIHSLDRSDAYIDICEVLERRLRGRLTIDQFLTELMGQLSGRLADFDGNWDIEVVATTTINLDKLIPYFANNDAPAHTYALLMAFLMETLRVLQAKGIDKDTYLTLKVRSSCLVIHRFD